MTIILLLIAFALGVATTIALLVLLNSIPQIRTILKKEQQIPNDTKDSVIYMTEQRESEIEKEINNQ